MVREGGVVDDRVRLVRPRSSAPTTVADRAPTTAARRAPGGDPSGGEVGPAVRVPRDRARSRPVPRPTTQPLRRPEALPVRMRTTRAVFLVLLTLVVPGAAQLAAGHRRIGRIAVRIWLSAAGLVVLLAALWFAARPVVLRLATSSLALTLLAGFLLLVGCLWPVLVVDAWRLGRPALLPRRVRLAMTALLVVSVALTSVPVLAAGRRVWAAASLLESVFGMGAASAAVAGRYNVLLLGGDAGPDRVGTRPDSVTLASIDATTGRTVLFGLPRNLEDIRFPEGSSAAAALPEGWTCGDECLLNGIYTWGAEHPEAFPGVADPGAAAMKQAVEGITGLKVNYYVLIDLMGFRQLIDAMGGIDLTVGDRVPIGGGTSRVSGYIEPGTQHLDGYHALWYARSRHGASDYARMERQRCVMDAMVRQMDPATLLARFQGIAAAAQNVVSTDIPASDLATFIDLGTRGKHQKITSVSFVPPLVDPAYPDFTLIGDRVVAALMASRQEEAEPTPPATARGAPAAGPATAAPSTGSASPAPSTSAQAVTAPPVDVGAVCSPA